MRFLALGIWEGGVLVKKLSGATRKVLFEARLSKGDRLLFTLGKADGQSAVYIWALIKHDDVSRKARAGIPDNAPFLDFPTETEETVEELYLDTAPDQWHTQEGMEEKVLADYGPQKWKILDDDEWERLLSAKNVNEVDFHLYLSKERYSILACDPPLLVSGTAGSGKTTIVLYYLSRKEFLGSSRLFVTSSHASTLASSYLRSFSYYVWNNHCSIGSNVIVVPPFFTSFSSSQVMIFNVCAWSSSCASIRLFISLCLVSMLEISYETCISSEMCRFSRITKSTSLPFLVL